MVVLATVATVIASQAVISGAFSITQQAMQLGFSPRMEISHTSDQQIGQIYLPAINWTLLLRGHRAGHRLWQFVEPGRGVWHRRHRHDVHHQPAGLCRREIRLGLVVLARLLGALPFAIIDLAFFSANSVKIADGGWFPLVLASASICCCPPGSVAAICSMPIWRMDVMDTTELHPRRLKA
jgi:KUP system potassium uptake protein